MADPERNRAIRVLPGGVVTDVVEADAEVFACVLGGADGRTLFLCVAPDSSPVRRRERTESRLLAVPVAVGGRN